MVTRQSFTDWMHEVFAPCVKKYPLEEGYLLLLDNAPAHPPGLEEDLVKEFDFIQVKSLPPNTTLILQLIDHQVISNYTFFALMACFGSVLKLQMTLNLLRESLERPFLFPECHKSH